MGIMITQHKKTPDEIRGSGSVYTELGVLLLGEQFVTWTPGRSGVMSLIVVLALAEADELGHREDRKGARENDHSHDQQRRYIDPQYWT